MHLTPHWLPMFLILLSNDVHFNPGPPFQKDFFNFMSVNSLTNDNFQRVRLIEAHNDLISICESSLKDSVELPETLLNGYTFVPANHPSNTRRGGVRLFFKNSLPVFRNVLSFDESIVIELGKEFLLFCIVVHLLIMPLLNFKPFC